MLFSLSLINKSEHSITQGSIPSAKQEEDSLAAQYVHVDE